MGWKKITSEAQVGKILSTMTMEIDHLANIDMNATEVSQESQNSLLYMREVSYPIIATISKRKTIKHHCRTVSKEKNSHICQESINNSG